MAKIVDNINKLQNDSIDLDLQARLSQVKKNMRGLDSSTEKYNKLVKEVLELQIKRLESEKKKLKDADLPEKITVQTNITKLEKELNRQIVSFTKYKLDTKANASLRNKTSVSLKDLENVFYDFIENVNDTVKNAASSSINLSEKKIFRSAINSKRDKQEAYHVGTTGSSEKDTRKRIAGVEVEHILESEKELSKALKEAFVDIKETIESTDSKREFDIQNEKFNLLVEVLNKNRGIIADNLEKELDKLISAVKGEVVNKGKLLTRLGGKYEDLKADAERLGVTQKLNAAGNSLAQGLGKLDSELGSFVEGIMSGIEGLDRFATGLFKLPETINNFKKLFVGAKLLFTGKSGPSQIDKLQEVKESIDQLGEKFTDVVQEKNSSVKENPELKKYINRIKGVNKVSKVQAEILDKKNKITKVSNSLLTLMNLEVSALTKSFGLLKVKSFFSGISTLLNRFTGLIVANSVSLYSATKTLISRSFLRGLGFFRIGLTSIGSIFSNLIKFTLPLLISGITALTTAIAGLSTPVLLLIGGISLAVGAILLFPKAIDSAIGYISKSVSSFVNAIKRVIKFVKDVISEFVNIVKKTIDYVKGLIPNLNPFGPSESEKQAAAMEQQIIEKTKIQSTSSFDGKNTALPTTASDKLMTGLISAETGNITKDKPAFDESRFIRTRAGADSSAYGPLQITKGLAKGSINNGIFDSDPELKKWIVEKYIPHGEKMLSSDYSDPTYGAGGKGDLSGPKDRAMYEKMGKILVAQTLENNSGDVLKSTGEWRLGESKKSQLGSIDPKYGDKVLTTVQNIENKQLQTVMDQRKNLEYTTQQQIAANQAKTMAQLLPPAATINQSSNNVQNESSVLPMTPIDLRNTESTFVRNMDSDFGLFR